MIAFSSSEYSNNSNQTFFEKYDGVVWQCVEIGFFKLQRNNGSKICDTRFVFWESCEKAKFSPNEGFDIYEFPEVKV